MFETDRWEVMFQTMHKKERASYICSLFMLLDENWKREEDRRTCKNYLWNVPNPNTSTHVEPNSKKVLLDTGYQCRLKLDNSTDTWQIQINVSRTSLMDWDRSDSEQSVMCKVTHSNWAQSKKKVNYLLLSLLFIYFFNCGAFELNYRREENEHQCLQLY